jgi:hypothetical protein
MKTKKSNIDELFRSGLGNYTEAPSRSLWRRISWQMLRTEVAHFNFTNIPAAWVAVPVAAVIIASLAVFDFNSPVTPEPDPLTEQQQPQSSGTVEPDLYTIDPETIEAPASGDVAQKIYQPSEQTASEIIAHSPSAKVDAITRAVYSSEGSQILPKNEDDNYQLVAQSQNDDLELPKASNESVEVETSLSNNDHDQMAIVTNADFKSFDSSTDQQTNNRETGSVEKLDKIIFRDIEPFTMQQRSLMDIKKSTLLNKTNEGDFTDESDAANLHSTGKTQRLHSLNSSLTYLLRGPYKPPKRDLQTQAIKNKKKSSHFTLALYAAPEITEYARMASTSREKSFAGGLMAGYTTPNYIFQVGVEMSYVYDLGDYMVNMETYDSVGYYHNVNGFIVDPENPGNVIFETQEVGVWDSVQHHSHQQTQNSYTYLQFPVMFGYKAMEYRNFSAYVKAGPSFSIMLNKNEPGLEFFQPDATVNGIDNYSLPRLSTNVQLIVSIGLQMQVCEKLGIMAEPFYRYYLGSVYEINSTGETLSNPYGLGLKAGVFYTF